MDNKMKLPGMLFGFCMLLLAALPAGAQTTNTDFQQAVATEKSPPIPEEARKHFVMGTTLFKDARTPDDYSQVENEFQQATELAPKWPDARYNLALAKEAAGDYSGAMADLKIYQQFKLSDVEVRTVQDKIYALEAKQKKAAKDKELATRKAVEENRAQQEAAVRKTVKIYGELVYWPNDNVLPTMTYSEAKSKIESVENNHEAGTRLIKNIQISSDMITWTVQTPWGFWHFASKFKSMKIYVSYHQSWKHYCLYLSNVKGDEQENGKTPRPYANAFMMFFQSSPDSDDAISLANAFYVLKRHAEGYDSAADGNGSQDSSQ